MKLVEMKCKKCGAVLNVEENKKSVVCDYCHTEFFLDDEVKHVEYDNMEQAGYEFEKGKIKAQEEYFNEQVENVMNSFGNKTFFKFFSFFYIIIFIFVFIIIGIIMFSIFKSSTKFNNDFNSKVDEFEVSSFNSKYEHNAGVTSEFFIKNDLGDIITNNKTNSKHRIIVNYKDFSGVEEDVILNVIAEISNKDYIVSFDYDSNGYICRMNISE